MIKTCTHLEAVVPDDLKLWLHQAFWRHRRNCARCAGKVKESSYAWENCECVLEHLVARKEIEEEDEKAPRKKSSRVAPKNLEMQKRLRLLDEYLAKGYVLRTFTLDDDFDGGDTIGRKEMRVVVENHSKEFYDIAEEDEGEEIAEMVREL